LTATNHEPGLAVNRELLLANMAKRHTGSERGAAAAMRADFFVFAAHVTEGYWSLLRRGRAWLPCSEVTAQIHEADSYRLCRAVVTDEPQTAMGETLADKIAR